MKCSYRGQYVNIGKVVGSKDNEIWTVIANEESDKTPLVLIHGFGSGSALWCLNFDSLATYRPVYAFDIIGKNCELIGCIIFFYFILILH